MKTWLKYGLWFVGIGVILALIGFVIIQIAILTEAWNVRDFGMIILTPFIIVGMIFSLSGILGCNFKQDACYPEQILGFVVTLLILFGIGALVGFIVNKLKSKSKSSKIEK